MSFFCARFPFAKTSILNLRSYFFWRHFSYFGVFPSPFNGVCICVLFFSWERFSVIPRFCKKLAAVLRCLPKYKLNYFVHINRQKLVFHFIYVFFSLSLVCVWVCTLLLFWCYSSLQVFKQCSEMLICWPLLACSIEVTDAHLHRCAHWCVASRQTWC